MKLTWKTRSIRREMMNKALSVEKPEVQKALGKVDVDVDVVVSDVVELYWTPPLLHSHCILSPSRSSSTTITTQRTAEMTIKIGHKNLQ